MPTDRGAASGAVTDVGETPVSTVPTRRVLLVCDWFLRYVAPFAEALRRADVEVALLCRDHASEFQGNRGERQSLLDRLLAGGVSLIEMPGANTAFTRRAWAAASEAGAGTPIWCTRNPRSSIPGCCSLSAGRPSC